MIVLCPTNCEHPYLFQHSVISNTRRMEVNKEVITVRMAFIVCRECGCWIDAKDCGCRFRCHAEPGGYTVDNITEDKVDCP